MSKASGTFRMTLPSKWLEFSWVEHVCKNQDQQVGGSSSSGTVYNTDVIDRPDLFLWIREHHFPQATPADFRKALRIMCRDQRPGYKESPLNPELRKVLGDRISAIGKRLWGSQVIELAIPTQLPNPPQPIASNLSSSESSSEHVNILKRRHVSACDTAAAALSSHSSIIPSTSQILVNHQLSSTYCSSHANALRDMRLAQAQRAGAFDALYAPTNMGAPAAVAASSSAPMLAHALRIQPLESTDSLLVPHMMTHEHLLEFNKMTMLLGYFQMSDVPAKHFKTLEHHFTRCFSHPGIVSFLVMKTDRFETGCPDVYANEQAEQLFAVGLTQVLHIIMGIDSTRKAVSCLTQSAHMNLVVAHVPQFWANTRDAFKNPCPRLVDMWLPRMLFNRNSFIVMIAPHRSVSLQTALEIFHAPP